MGRDYAGEMRALIDTETAGSRYVSGLVAAKIVERLKEEDPELLEGWLYAGAAQFLRHSINLRDSALRSKARNTAGRSFQEAADAFEAGDKDALSPFMMTVHTIQNNTRVRLGDMYKAELIYVAEDYGRRAEENRLQGAFLKALAKRVGDKKVSEIFTEEELQAMWLSLSATSRQAHPIPSNPSPPRLPSPTLPGPS